MAYDETTTEFPNKILLLGEQSLKQYPWTNSSQIPLTITCSNCHSSMLNTFNFCNVCGAPSTMTQAITSLSSSSQNSSLSTSPMITPPKTLQNEIIIPQPININDDDDDDYEGEFDFSSINDLVDNMSPVSQLRKEENLKKKQDDISGNENEIICKFFSKGKCRRGKNCSFKHQTSSIRSPVNLKGSELPLPQSVQTEISVPQSNNNTNHDQHHLHPQTDNDVLSAVATLGLPCTTEAVQTVGALVEALREQCKESSVTSAKASATLNRLLHSPQSSTLQPPAHSTEGAPSRNLYVHGFGAETDERDVEALFSMFCEVKCVVMKEVLNRSTGEVEGRYCFVWTGGVQQASTARAALDKFELNGQTLQVNFAKDRKSPLDHSEHLARQTNQKKDDHNHRTPPSNPPSRNLFVANFSESFTASDIAALFSKYCEVKRVVMKSAGYCFVWTGGPSQAVHALNCLNGTDINGSVLQVGFAKERDSGQNRTTQKRISNTLTQRNVIGSDYMMSQPPGMFLPPVASFNMRPVFQNEYSLQRNNY